MKNPTPAILARLGLVLGIMGGLAGLHAGFSIPTVHGASASAPAEPPGRALAAGPSDPAAGYGLAGCESDGRPCAGEFCAAPGDSGLSGYAVPCDPRTAG